MALGLRPSGHRKVEMSKRRAFAWAFEASGLGSRMPCKDPSATGNMHKVNSFHENNCKSCI